MQTPIFSIVIPSFNRADLLPRTLRSVQQQTFTNYEILVVDDCSTDNTETLLQSSEFKDIRYIKHAKNQGAAQARNTGIASARGAYVCFLDSDDVWLPEKLATQNKLIEEVDAKVVGSQSIKLDEASQRCLAQFHPQTIATDSPDLFANLHINTSSLCIRHDLLKVVKGFDTALKNFEDWDLILKLAQHISRIYITSEMSVISYTHEFNTSKTTNPHVKYENGCILYQKHQKYLTSSPKHTQKLLYELGCYARDARQRIDAAKKFYSAWKILPFSKRGFKSLFRLIVLLSLR